MDINTIKNKFAGLSLREKAITIITLSAIVILVPYSLLYSPSAVKVKIKQQELQNIKKEFEAINLTLASQMISQKEPSAKTEKITLPDAEDLSGMLAAISREANIARVDFVSIAPEGFIHKDKFIEMKVKIELRVRFRELYDFLKNIEARHKLFLIQELKFETNPTVYPSGIALLKAVTYLKKKQ